MGTFRRPFSFKEARTLQKKPPLGNAITADKWERIKHLPNDHAQIVRFKYLLKIYNATPWWLTDSHLNKMKVIYQAAGPNQHVDHIVPLLGKTVCGLHVPWNLQVINAQTNQAKSNSYWPDMPFEPIDMFDEYAYSPFQLE